MSARTLISVADFDQLDVPEGYRYELDEGELLEMVKPRYNPHNRIVMILTRALLAYVEKNPVGEVLLGDNLYILSPTTKRIPDLSFLTNERVNAIEPDRDIQGGPDLAIEVLSPSDTASAMRRKMKQYFGAGTKVVWLVFPETREVEIWESETGPARVVKDQDSLEAPGLLPGFALNVNRLF